MSYDIKFTKQAVKDYEKVKRSTLSKKAKEVLHVLESNPYTLPYEKLEGLHNTYSRRLNIQHRIVYEVVEVDKIVVILRMWTHYDKL